MHKDRTSGGALLSAVMAVAVVIVVSEGEVRTMGEEEVRSLGKATKYPCRVAMGTERVCGRN
jgi:hypothetical protein